MVRPDVETTWSWPLVAAVTESADSPATQRHGAADSLAPEIHLTAAWSMTLVELAGLISVVGTAGAAAITDDHATILTRVAAFLGGGVVGLAVYLAALLLTAGTLARSRIPELDQPEGSQMQRCLAVCLLLSVPASPIVAILASSELTSWLLSL